MKTITKEEDLKTELLATFAENTTNEANNCLLNSLNNNPNITYLKLSLKNVKKQIVYKFSEILITNTSLKKLTLYNTILTNNNFYTIYEALIHNYSLMYSGTANKVIAGSFLA